MLRSVSIVGALLSILLVTGCPDSEPPENELPTAVLVAPETGIAGIAVELSAEASTDSDGVLVEYRFIFADGSPLVITADPITTHIFEGPSIYGMSLIVFDDRGGSARADAEIVVGTPENPPECMGDGDCPGGTCVMGTCI